MLVGLNGICVKSHGGTDAIGFAHAIEAGVKLVEQNFNEVIKQDLIKLTDVRQNKNLESNENGILN